MSRLVVLLALLVVLLAMPGVARAQDGPGISDGPGGEVATPSEEPGGACERLPWGVETVCDGVGASLMLGMQPVLASGAQAVLHEMVSFVVEGAGWLLEQVASFLDTSTRPQLTSSWFGRVYADMSVVAVFGLLPFLLLAIVQGIVRQDAGMLLRSTFGYVPLAAIGTAAGVVVVDLLVQLTDLLTVWVGRSLGSDLAAFSTGMGEALTSLPAGTGGPVAGLAALLAAGVVAFAAFAIWLELLLRQAAIYVAVLFLPLGFMAMVWPATAHWLRRLVQGLVAIILSKFVIVAVMALAAAALGGEPGTEAGIASGAGSVVGSEDGGGFGVVLAGASMLALAALAPYVLLRLIPVFDAGLSGELEGTVRRPTAAVGSPTAGHHLLQTVRHHGGGGHGGAPAAADASRGREAEVSGGPSGGPGASPATAGGGSSPGGSSGLGAGPGPGGGGASPAGGGAAASGAAVGTGVVAAGVGTVAAGAGGAKKVGDHLQTHGAEQQAATSSSRAGRTAPAGPGAAPSQRSPAPDAGTPAPRRPATSPSLPPKTPRARPPREGS